MNRDVRFLHIGDYKTGTTWLQRHVFGVDDQIYLLGEGGDPVDSSLWARLEQLTYGDVPSVNDWAASFRAEAIRSTSATRPVWGISRESLISGDLLYLHDWRARAEDLYQAFGGAKVILTFREQRTLLSSVYSTYIKNGGTKSMHAVFDPTKLYDRVDYFSIAERYADLFGRQNVLFLSFDELRRDSSNYVGKIYDFIGLAAPQRVSVVETNRSLRRPAASLQRLLNAAVRSQFNPADRAPPTEYLVGLLLAERPSNGLHPLERRRASTLPQGRGLDRVGGGHQYPVANYRYLNGLRGVSERMSFGPRLNLPSDIWASLEVDVGNINARLLDKFGVDLSQSQEDA